MKKTIITLLAIMLAAQAWAHVDGLHWFNYNGLYYRLYKSEVTIWVTVWESKSYKKLTTVTIPETITYKKNIYKVTTIGCDAFSGCSGLTSVTIPNSVTSIGSSAFSGCSSLASVYIPNSVTSIDEDAFYGCKSLASVTIKSEADFEKSKLYFIQNGIRYKVLNKNSVEVVSSNSYTGEIVIPETVTAGNTFTVVKIGYDAFSGCSSLTSIHIPNSVTSIGESAFRGCSSLTSIHIPNSVTRIGKRAFYGCSSLASVYISNSVTSIGEDAFYGCKSLTSVYISKSVTSIGSNAA